MATRLVVRPAGEEDSEAWVDLYTAIAGEGRWIGAELPVDREQRRRRFLDGLVNNDDPAIALVAEADGRQVGQLELQTHAGIGDLGIAVDAGWRGQGVGTALMAAALDWARQHQLHKLALQLWPHNTAAWALYQKFGFVQEGWLRRQYRRRNGELWDAIVMGLVLDETSPGCTTTD